MGDFECVKTNGSDNLRGRVVSRTSRYIHDWPSLHTFESGIWMSRLYRIYSNLSTRVYQKLERTIPGFDKAMEKVQADATARDQRRKARRDAEKQAELEKAFGGI